MAIMGARSNQPVNYSISLRPIKGVFAVTALLLASVSQAQWLRFQFKSEPGDFIGLGETRDIQYRLGASDMNFLRVSLSQRGTIGPDFITISSMKNPISTDFMSALIGTNQLNQPLQVGSYANAMRASFADPGRPGLDVGF